MEGTNSLIKFFLADIDGSLMPQSDVMDARVGTVLRELSVVRPMGVATGKGADYARALSAGNGFHWNVIGAESGALFWRLKERGPPPIWEITSGAELGTEDLALFRDAIQLDLLRHEFRLGRDQVRYRPELKERILTFFPADAYLDGTLAWREYFEDVIKAHRLGLIVKRHAGDGAIDVVPADVNKRLVVERVCRLYSCGPHQILTVVDGDNDDELATGTTAIVPANGKPRIRELVKRQGGYLATRPDGFGFVEGLLHYAKLGVLAQSVTDTLRLSVGMHLPAILQSA